MLNVVIKKKSFSLLPGGGCYSILLSGTYEQIKVCTTCSEIFLRMSIRYTAICRIKF